MRKLLYAELDAIAFGAHQMFCSEKRLAAWGVKSIRQDSLGEIVLTLDVRAMLDDGDDLDARADALNDVPAVVEFFDLVVEEFHLPCPQGSIYPIRFTA